MLSGAFTPGRVSQGKLHWMTCQSLIHLICMEDVKSRVNVTHPGSAGLGEELVGKRLLPRPSPMRSGYKPCSYSVRRKSPALKSTHEKQ